jgi:hypothetical protein
MSLTFASDVSRKRIVKFLKKEYEIGSDIPVHLYSIVNARFPAYNGMLAITDNQKGNIVLEDEHMFKAYGDNNPLQILAALNCCRIYITIL